MHRVIQFLYIKRLKKTVVKLGLRPSHTAAITTTITTHRERIELVELLYAEYAHARANSPFETENGISVLEKKK